MYLIISLPDYDYWGLFKDNNLLFNLYADSEENVHYFISGFRLGRKIEIPPCLDIPVVEYCCIDDYLPEMTWCADLDRFKKKLKELNFEISYESHKQI